MKDKHKTIRYVLFAIAALAILARIFAPAGNSINDERAWTHVRGATMGATYEFKFALLESSNPAVERERIGQQLQSILSDIEQRVSTWRPGSQLSLFNAQETTDWFAVDSHTVQMVALAHEINTIDDRFDITIALLSELWGLGPSGPVQELPSPAAIDECLAHIGMNKLEYRSNPPALRKLDPQLRIDLSALAAGYVADLCAQHLRSQNVDHFFIDVAGEIVVGGRNQRGEKWRIGIAEPKTGSTAVQTSLELEDCGIATSGNYRKFIELNGERFGHILDAKNGYPAQSDVLSATVVNASCARADAIATVLMTMPADEAVALANSQNWQVLLLVTAGKEIAQIRSNAMVME